MSGNRVFGALFGLQMESICQALRTHMGSRILGPDFLEGSSGLHGSEAAHLSEIALGTPLVQKSHVSPLAKLDPISIRFRSDFDISIRFRSDFDLPPPNFNPISIRFRSPSRNPIRFRSDFDLPPEIRSDFDPISIPPQISIRFRSDFDTPPKFRSDFDPISTPPQKSHVRVGKQEGVRVGVWVGCFLSVSRNLRE